MAKDDYSKDIQDLAIEFSIDGYYSDYSLSREKAKEHKETNEELLIMDGPVNINDADIVTVYAGIEMTEIRSFVNNTCGCKLFEGKSCSRLFDYHNIVNYRCEALELEKDQLDLVILTAIRMLQNKDGSMAFTFQGMRVCLKTFLFLHALSKKRYYNLRDHYLENGLCVRQHGNKRKKPPNSFSHQDIQLFKTFITNYTEEHAVSLPGHYPGYKNINYRLLPTDTTKFDVWKMYASCSEKQQVPCVGLSKFKQLWKELVPYLRIMGTMTDLCSSCQTNNTAILSSANLSETEKLKLLIEQETHLYLAELERNYYPNSSQEARKKFEELNLSTAVYQNKQPCSINETFHYSFDWAQQVHVPTNPLQPGEIYFLTPRKIGIFGITNEAIPRQINYLVDEIVNTGKGANANISFLHHFFETYGFGESCVHLHCDNCVGQNKNNFLIGYLMWRICVGLHEQIIYSFMIAGHTKFLCDAHFGMAKKRLRRKYTSSLFEVSEAFENSSVNNVSQLVGYESGEILVPTYNWKSIAENYFVNIPNISQYQHFRFSKDHIGVVFCKFKCDGEEIPVNIQKKNISPPKESTLPNIILPDGLPDARKKYLFEKIRKFCKESCKDLVTPDPDVTNQTPHFK